MIFSVRMTSNRGFGPPDLSVPRIYEIVRITMSTHENILAITL